MEAPKLDDRTAPDVLAQAQELAKTTYLAGVWTGYADPGDPAFQLLGVFGRLMEILIERLNRVPEKNLLAFLDMVGVEPSPGFPAALPVTFLPSPKAPEGGLIPAGTQVATTQTDVADAQLFETRRAIHATPAKLVAALNLLATEDKYSIIPAPTLPPKPVDLSSPPEITVLSPGASGLLDLPHRLYLASAALFGRKETLDVTLVFTVVAGDPSVLNGANLRWQKLDKATKAWMNTGATYPPAPAGQVQVVLSSFGENDKTVIAGREDFWVVVDYDGPLTGGVLLPSISSVKGSLAPAGSATSAHAPAQLAFANTFPLDLSKPFLPFGVRPRYGDAFYVSSSRALAPEVDVVTLTVDVKGYTPADLQAVFKDVTILTTVTTTVLWQYLATDGTWKAITEFQHTLTASPGAPPVIVRQIRRDGVLTTTEEGTFFGLVGTSQSVFSFTLPSDIGSQKVHGQDGFWIRALLKSEDPYGRDAFIASADPLKVVGSTLLPPVVEDTDFSFTYKSQLQDVSRIVTENNLRRVDHGPGSSAGYPIAPFIAPWTQTVGTQPAIFAGGAAVYLGFDRPFGDVYISLYFRLRENFPTVDTPAEGGKPIVAWEYLAPGWTWRPLDVEDETAQLIGSGTASFVAREDAVPVALFDGSGAPLERSLYWLRARLASGHYERPPVLLGVYPNTVVADNLFSFRSELVLGSGSGEKSQKLALPKAPVLGGELWVREPEAPPRAELDALREELGRAVSLFAGEEAAAPGEPVEPAKEGERQVWVRWVRAPNFLGSGPRSRHYTLNPLDGALGLGDGSQGMMAPPLKDNLVFRDFRTGGGEEANRVAVPLAVKELKSSLPYVDKVFNVEGAVGGSDPWDLEDILSFGPQFIKNKGRAVSAEDFEWMVLQRFSQVARVKALSTRAPGPAGLVFKPGAVTLVVVPKSHERLPRPSSALLETIRDFIAEQALGAIATDIYVLGPGFTVVAVSARVRALDPRTNSEVERRALQALEDFFHPLYGGESREGWSFGRDVQLSEVYAVLQRVDGVDYVESVEFPDAPGATSLDIGENNLVASGSHHIEMI
jgi:hypothetical protein